MKRFLFSILSLALAALPFAAQAQNFQLFPGEASGANDFRIYVQQFYFFSIGAGILIATVLIMIGGIMWTTSAGNPGRIDKAKSYIIDSIIGVVLLIGAYTILQVVNPNLVNLKLPEFPKFTIKLGACLYQTTESSGKSGQKCIESAEEQCNQLPAREFTAESTCADVCRVKDSDGFCVTNPVQYTQQAEQRNEDPQKTKCDIQGNYGRGTSIPNNGINMLNCRRYCEAAGQFCYAQSWDDIDSDNMLCKCVYSPSGPP